MCSKSRLASSDLRRPAPRRMASTAASRIPLIVVRSGRARSCSACSAVSQWPRRTPPRLAPLARAMPAASSGAITPLSAASRAKAADCRQPDVDAGGRQSFDLQLCPVLLNGGFVELAAGIVAEPDQELVQSLRVRTTRVTGGDAIQYQRCDDSPTIVASVGLPLR